MIYDSYSSKIHKSYFERFLLMKWISSPIPTATNYINDFLMIFRLLFQSYYRSRFWKIFLLGRDIFLSVAAPSTSKIAAIRLNYYLFDPN